MALLVAGIVVTATLAAGGGARTDLADLAGAPTPLKYVCAAKGSGVLRYVSSLARCRPSERGLAIRPGPILVCVSGDGSVLRVASARSCARSHPRRTFLRLPPLSGTLAFCAAREGGRLRSVSSPGKCRPSELRLSVVAADKAPIVTGSQPAAGAVGVATDAKIAVSFSESVTAGTNSFTLACPASSQQAFTVSGSPGQTITLTPTSALPAGTTCTVTVLAARISDTDTVDAPDHPAADHTFSFTTDSAPAVTSTSPVNGAGGVGAGSDITIGFSEPVSAGANAFTLQCPAGSPQPFTVGGSPGASITLHPASALPVGTTCAVGAVAAQISDTDTADPPDHPASDLTFTFTTAGDGGGGGGPVDTAPSVTATSPADHAADVPPGTGITVTFSEPVDVTAASFTIACASTPRPFTVGGSSTATIMLTPTAPLPAATSCTVTALADAISDVDSNDPPDHPASDFSFSFTTAGPGDAAPSVTATSPADGATGIDPAAPITVTFSEPVTATAASFTIACASTPQPFTVGGSSTATITLTPTAPLPTGASCTVTARADGISDVDSNDPPDHPASDFSFSFLTGSGTPVDTAPSVTGTTPADHAADVPPGTSITVTFSEPVTVSAASFTIACASTQQPFTIGGGSGTDTITLNPNTALPAATSCTVTARADGISDVDSNDPPDHPASDFSFSFTTAGPGDAAPSVTATTPADHAADVPPGTSITVTFSEPVTVSAASFTIACASTQQPFTIGGGSGTDTITLNPNTALPAATSCTVTARADAISDVDSNDPPDHPASDFSFSFTTAGLVDAAPSVTATTPANGATGIDPAAPITVTFSEPVTATAASFTITCASTPQPFTVGGSGTATTTLTPTAPLPTGASCTVTALAAGISDVDTDDPPDHPASDFSFSFTTAGPGDAAPSVTATTPANGATGVDPAAPITVTFSEPVTVTAASFTIACASTPQPFTVGGSGTDTITLTPNTPLPTGASCTVTALAAGISDVDTDDPPDHPTADHVFSFTTAGPGDAAPTDIALSAATVAENQPAGTPVGTLSTTDPDAGDTFTYSLVPGTGSAGNGSFRIVGDALQTNASLDFEATPTLTIRIRSTDSGGLFVEKAFTVTVTNVNEAPTAVDDSATTDEDTAANLDPRVNDTDPDAGDTLTITSVGTPDNGGSVTITGGGTGVQFTPGAAFQDLNVGESRVTHFAYTITDAGGLSSTATVTITVTGVNDAPTAVADTFDGSNSALAGVTLAVGTSPSGPTVAASGNVLTNDTDVDTAHANLTATAGTTSASGGIVTMNADGTFTYVPPPGFIGDDTFTYAAHDHGSPDLAGTGTVTIHVVGPRVWFVNPGGAAGNGTSASPFASLAPLTTGGGSDSLDGAGDIIFVYQGTGNAASAGFVLEPNQQLVGQPQGLTVTDTLARTFNLVGASGANPTVTNSVGAGLTLADGNTIQRINVTSASGAGVTGSAIGTLTYGANTTISGNSGGGLVLTGAAGGAINVGANITTTAGHSVSISNRSGGTTTLAGAINDTGTGISLSSNTGATINLTGGIVANTGANTAFVATGGGTVAVTGSANTLTTTTGTALNVANTTIGASGLIFQSISSDGASSGIVLNSTGSSGGLTVTGTGAAGTGGTIQNSTSSGILGAATSNLTLSFMNVLDNGNAVNEGGIRLTDLTGTGAITSSTVRGSAEDNIYLMNNTATPLTSFTIGGAGCSVTDNRTFGNVGLNLLAAGSANMTATVDGCSWSGNRTIAIRADSADSSKLNVTIRNNTITQGSPNHGNQGIEVSDAANGNVTFDVENNNVGTPNGTTVSPLSSTGINIFNGSEGDSVMVGKIAGNVVLNDPTITSGASNGLGIRVFNFNLGAIRAIVTNNVVKNASADYGIQALSSGATAAPSGTHGRLDVEISNNNVDVGPDALDAIRAQALASNTVCARINGNTTDAGGAGFAGIFVRQANTAVFQLDGWNGTGTPEAFVAAQNPFAGSTGSAGTITGVPAGTCNFSGIP